MAKLGEGHEKLWRWFGLSYASFVTIPRVMMREMPDEWQGKMAELLEEFDETYPNQIDLPEPYVTARKNYRFTKWPEWLLNYRRPNVDKIKELMER